MESTGSKLARKLINFIIAGGWLWLFNTLGWITFTAEMPLWQAIVLTALVAWLIEWIVDFVFFAFILVSCGVGCFAFPLIMFAQGWIFLVGAERVTHLFTINVGFLWVGLLMSIALGLLRIPAETSSSQSINK